MKSESDIWTPALWLIKYPDMYGVLNFYCCVANYHKFSSFKHKFAISHFLWFSAQTQVSQVLCLKSHQTKTRYWPWLWSHLRLGVLFQTVVVSKMYCIVALGLGSGHLLVARQGRLSDPDGVTSLAHGLVFSKHSGVVCSFKANRGAPASVSCLL